eukprot:scaffold227063_cov32-Tisochrysis_lutea.AAC.1
MSSMVHGRERGKNKNAVKLKFHTIKIPHVTSNDYDSTTLVLYSTCLNRQRMGMRGRTRRTPSSVAASGELHTCASWSTREQVFPRVASSAARAMLRACLACSRCAPNTHILQQANQTSCLTAIELALAGLTHATGPHVCTHTGCGKVKEME